ncbi:hypothetical protein OJAV_G00056200 [Oryzias javanicus]|uniref:LysM and putative peptidoglycan-binding domain-containing protein 4 n=1 Tax=Oryzias javanicus TaxID=123683 RepID=A0A437D9H8_ORYJA|nr:hypothetical protein OJAV_G00056200 [Oryzias javanicus]
MGEIHSKRGCPQIKVGESAFFLDQTGPLLGCCVVMRRGEHGSQAFQAPVDVHASADGQVFMFRRPANELTASSDDEELSVVELRQTKPDNRRNVQLLERKVLEDDNLSKLALQYGCKVGDIKRVNNLMREQDLFALKSIKIPVQKHSFLTETLPGRDDPPEETPHSSVLTTDDSGSRRGCLRETTTVGFETAAPQQSRRRLGYSVVERRGSHALDSTAAGFSTRGGEPFKEPG